MGYPGQPPTSRNLVSRVGPSATTLLAAGHAGNPDVADIAETIADERLLGAAAFSGPPAADLAALDGALNLMEPATSNRRSTHPRCTGRSASSAAGARASTDAGSARSSATGCLDVHQEVRVDLAGETWAWISDPEGLLHAVVDP